MNNHSPHNPDEYWQFVDQILSAKLSLIQRQGPHWSNDPVYRADPAEREEFVFGRWVELVAELAAATQAVRLRGHRETAAQGEMLLHMVQNGDVRTHEVREAIDTYCRQFHPAHPASTTPE